MSLEEFALCGHAQSGNILNLENISIIAIYSGNVPMLTKEALLDLNNSVHILDIWCSNVQPTLVQPFQDNGNVKVLNEHRSVIRIILPQAD